MTKTETKCGPLNGPTQINQLLYFLELLNQTLEVKMESLFAFPMFMEAAIRHAEGKRNVGEVAAVGTTILKHLGMLNALILKFGGNIDQDARPQSGDQREPIATYYFQEELSLQILRECCYHVRTQWKDSELRRLVEEQLETLVHETRAHLELLDRYFATKQPQYRDVVLERFRVTAIP